MATGYVLIEEEMSDGGGGMWDESDLFLSYPPPESSMTAPPIVLEHFSIVRHCSVRIHTGRNRGAL